MILKLLIFFINLAHKDVMPSSNSVLVYMQSSRSLNHKIIQATPNAITTIDKWCCFLTIICAFRTPNIKKHDVIITFYSIYKALVP